MSPAAANESHLFFRTFFRLSLLVTALLAPSGSGIEAQTPERGIFVAVPETFPALDVRAIVVRERARDVVVLPKADVTPEVLAMALLVLREARAKNPRPTEGVLMPITGFALTSELPGADRRRLAAALERLEDRPIRDIGSFGPGRWISYSAGR